MKTLNVLLGIGYDRFADNKIVNFTVYWILELKYLMLSI